MGRRERHLPARHVQDLYRWTSVETGSNPHPTSCRGPPALANEAGGPHGRVSPSTELMTIAEDRSAEGIRDQTGPDPNRGRAGAAGHRD